MTVFRHAVLLRFRDEATEDQIQAVLDGLGTMPARIPRIRRYDFGRDLGVMEGNPDVALVADFDSVEDWRAYQEHPDHVKLVTEVIRPILESMTRVQYEVFDP